MPDKTQIQFPTRRPDLEPAVPASAPGVGAQAGSRRQCPAAFCASCGRTFGAQARFCPFDGERLSRAARPAPLDPLLGSVLGEKYRVDQVLGEGGMGSVYVVTHLVLARRMAAKVLRAELAREPHLAARFLREARAAASIGHPNVVKITDFGTSASGQAYFIMELLSGESLRSLLSAGPMEPERVARISRQVADGLAAAHRAGIVHRDLKPDNVQVDTELGDHVRVLDFGLARIAGATRLTGQGVVFGTPQYMSPEQAAGDALDQRTDVYALGVMMYEMLAGHVPFDAPTFMGVLRQHLRKAPRALTRVAPDRDFRGLEPIVMRCLAKRPAKRFANMTEVASALERVGDPNGTPRATQPSDSAAALTPRAIASGLGLWLFGLLGLCLGLTAAWLFADLGPPSEGSKNASPVAPAALSRPSVSPSRRAPPGRRSGRGAAQPPEESSLVEPVASSEPQGTREAAHVSSARFQRSAAEKSPVAAPSDAEAAATLAPERAYPPTLVDPWPSSREHASGP